MVLSSNSVLDARFPPATARFSSPSRKHPLSSLHQFKDKEFVVVSMLYPHVYCLHEPESFLALVVVLLDLLTAFLMLGLLPPFPVFQAHL